MKKIKSKITTLTLILTCIFCFSQCHKNSTPAPDNPYGLPNATQTGAGVFACRINGVNAIAKNNIPGQSAGIVNDTVEVEGSALFGHYFESMYLGVLNPEKNISYNLSDTVNTYCVFVTDSTCQLIVGITTIKPHIGNITFTKIDINNKIISGTFNFKAPIAGCDTLNVTDGRFDIRYY